MCCAVDLNIFIYCFDGRYAAVAGWLARRDSRSNNCNGCTKSASNYMAPYFYLNPVTEKENGNETRK